MNAAATSRPQIALSVVLAVWRGEAALAAFVEALAPQVDALGVGVELLAVADRDPPPSFSPPPWLAWHMVDAEALVPELWASGIERARGEVVVLTTARFVPASDWLEAIRLAHHRLGSAAVGGRIDPPAPRASAADWATYFGRYGRYLDRRHELATADLAGDNVSYRRQTLEAHRASWADGFWEPEVHAALEAAGERLTFVPTIGVRQAAGFGTWQFCGQRLRHGRQYGSDRLRGRALPLRLLAALALPLLPLLLVGRVVRVVTAEGGFLAPLARSYPWLVLFAIAWSVGEVSGYLVPRPALAGRTK